MSGIGGIGGGFGLGGFGGFSNKFSGGQGGSGLMDVLKPSTETSLLREIKEQRDNPNVKFKVKEEEKKREAAEQREQQAQQNADTAQQSQKGAQGGATSQGQGQAENASQGAYSNGSGLETSEGATSGSFNATMAEMAEAEKQKQKKAQMGQGEGVYFSAAGLRQAMPERGQSFVSPFVSSDIYVRSETSAMRQAREYFAKKQTASDEDSPLVPYSVTLLNEPDMAELNQDTQTALNYDRDRVSHVIQVMKKEQELQARHGEDIKVGFNMSQGRYEMLRPGDPGYQDVKSGPEIQSELSETFNRGYLDRQDFQGVFQKHNLYL